MMSFVMSSTHPRLSLTRLLFVYLVLFLVPSFAHAALRRRLCQDITPTQFPVIVNGGFTSSYIATKANDTLHARAIVLDNGKARQARDRRG